MYSLEKGIRLPRSQSSPPSDLPLQRRLAIPMEWGETSLVQVGEQVRLGQRIADGAGEMVPLHASASGTVTAVAPKTCADGKRHPTIVIENDGLELPDMSIRRRALLDDLSDELLLALLFEAGIRLPDGTPLASAVGDAGPGLKMLIINAMDLEPGCCTEDAALCGDGEAALSGIRILERLTKPEIIVVAVGAHQKNALRAAGRWTGKRLRLAVLPDVYPAAHPRRLAELLGDLRPGASPRESGILVLPITAAADCGHAAYEGSPVIHQNVCVNWGAGQAIFRAPLGTPVSAVLEAAGQSGDTVLLGGPMTGMVLDNLTVPITKGMACLTLLPAAAEQPQTACIRCGRCASVCPANLKPYLSLLRPGRLSWRRCLRCGACQYCCPAGLPLLQAMYGKRKEAAGIG